MHKSERMKKIFRGMSLLSIWTLISVLMLPAHALGGSLLAPTSPTAQPDRYTLKHIYDLVKTGTSGTAIPAGAFVGPNPAITSIETTLAADSAYTLNDIYNAAPKPNNSGATRNEVCSGKAYFSLLTASTSPSGTWGSSLSGLKDCTAAPVAADVTISLGNEPTTAQTISITTIRGGCSDTDSTLTNSSITVSAITSVRGATLSRTDTNNLSYTPSSTLFKYLHAGETTRDAFTYSCTDGVTGHDRTATVYLTVNGVDDAPVASNAAVTVTEDTPAAFNFSVASADRDLSSLNYNILSGPSYGTATRVTNTNAYIYTPDLNNTTGDSFTYEACIPSTSTCSSTRTVTISFTAVNDAPSFTLASPRDLRRAVGTGSDNVSNFALNISKGASSESAQTLTFNISKNDPSSILVGTPSINTGTGQLSFTVHASNTGTATMTVTLSDSGGGSDTSGAELFTITTY
ncbi:MAG: hypothetical protein C0402_09075 [Thermodesulfovibrio sp.]|nr:hypothetical protein [Thermodesulfovibrio sp.]